MNTRAHNGLIRVAQVIGKANLSGVDTIVMEYYRHIDRSKIQFDFIIDGYDETPIDKEIQELGGRIYKVEPYARNIAKNINQCYAIFKENQYPIVHSHLNTLSVFPLYAAWRAKVPIRIAHNHNTAVIGEGKRSAMKYLLRPFAKVFATHYCACSATAGRWLFGDALYDAGKVHIIKNAINIDKFSYNSQIRNQLRRNLSLEGKLVVGHVGRFVYQKNHDLLIDIFQEIHKRNDQAVLMLVGAGELEQTIRAKVAALGLAEAVLFLGLRTDVAELMQAMDVFVFPSHYEGLGMVAIEAQAAGLRTIVSEAIPEDAKITELLEYCHLSQPAFVWAERIFVDRVVNEEQRQAGNRVQLQNSGYDIALATDQLSKWYEELVQQIRNNLKGMYNGQFKESL